MAWVEQSNFYDYRVPRMNEVPPMHVEVIQDRQPSHRRWPDGDAADRAGDIERGYAARRHSPASHAVHSRASQEGVGLSNDK